MTTLFRVLGAVEVVRGEPPAPVALGGAQQRRLLALLLTDPGKVISLARIVDAMWPYGESPGAAPRTVRTYVSRLRAAIGDEFIHTVEPGYILELGVADADHITFGKLVAEAARTPPSVALSLLADALALWNGPAFAEFADEWWAQPEVARLEEVRLGALEQRVDALAALGRDGECLIELERLTAAHPHRERFVAQYMTSLHRTGREAEAHRVFQAYRDRLADESGLDPSRSLVDLDRSIAGGRVGFEGQRRARGYDLHERLGEGTFATVYRGVQIGLGREVAVKVVRADLADDLAYVQRFELEAQLVARLEHPHIVPLYDFWREPGGAFLVFRLMRGDSADRRISRDRPWSLERLARLVNEVGGALGAAHRRGVIHRDVRPANILFDEDDRAYLGDFGIAVLAEASASRRPAYARSPVDHSPELAGGSLPDARSDQYSLAATIWELLVGEAPFAVGDDASCEQMLVASLPSTRRRRPDVPERLDAVLRRAGSLSPADRYESVEEFVAAWNAAAGTLSSDVLSETFAPFNPYKGLRAFREADVGEYFGRAALVDDLAGRVGAQSFVALIGASGSGKSSLVHAGLLPRCRADPRVLAISMTPGPHPLEALADAFEQVAPVSANLDGLRLGKPDALGIAMTGTLRDGASRLILVIDQLEELWTDASHNDSRSFLDMIAATTARGDERLRVVTTIRADWLDRPLQDPALGPLVAKGAVHITLMTPAELQQAVVAPATRAGLTVEPALVAELVARAASDAGRGALPLLQFTLTALAEARSGNVITEHAYKSLGGLAGALASCAEAIVEQLDLGDSDATRRLFGQLVVLGDDGPDARRRVRRHELVGVPDSVIDRFVAHRILTVDHDPSTRAPTIEIAHEALLDHWPRLVGWLADDRDELRAMQRLRDAARAWDDAGHDSSVLLRGARLQVANDLASARKLSAGSPELALVEASVAADAAERVREAAAKRRLQRLVVGIGVLLVVALVAAGLAFAQRRDARASATRAEAARLVATAESLATLDTPVAALLALEAAGADDDATNAAIQRILTAKPGFLGALPSVGEYAFSPDGAILVVRTASGVETYDLDSRLLIGAAEHVMEGGIPGRRVAVSGGLVLETSGSREVMRWTLPNLSEVEPVVTQSDVDALVANESGTLVTGHADGTVAVWDAGNGDQRTAFTVDGPVSRLSLSRDGSAVAVATPTSTAVYRTEDGQPLGPSVAEGPFDEALSPDGSLLVVATNLFETITYDAATGEQLATLPSALYAHFIDDANVALSFGFAVTVVDARNATTGRTVETTCGCDFAVSADGSTIASGLDSLGLYSLEDAGLLTDVIPAPPEAQQGGLVSITRSADAKLLGIGWSFGGIRVLERGKGAWQTLYQTPPEDWGGLLPDGSLLRFSFEEGSIVDPRTGAELGRFPGVGPVAGFGANPDRRLVALGLPDGAVAVMDTATHQEVARLTDLQELNATNDFPFIDVAWGVAFSPDGQWLVASTWSGASVAWAVNDWSDVRVLTPGVVDVNGAARPAFEQAGRLLAVSYGRVGMRLFDGDTLERVAQIDFANQGLPQQATFDPTGTRLAVTFDTAKTVTYDVATGETIGSALPAAPLASATFLDPDTLVLAAKDSTAVLVWHLDGNTLRTQACRAAGRNLTRAEWKAFGPRGASYRLTCPQFGEPAHDPTRSVDIPANQG